MQPDVIVAGGGIAGAAITAALSEFNYTILVIEPGLDHAKRLAGELIHPPGVANLESLGLLAPLKEAGAMPVAGFAVISGAGTHLLPYSDVPGLRPHGLALEHGTIANSLLDEVAKRPNVTVWKGGRVTAVDLASPSHATATIARNGQETRITARLLVAADGRSSHVRGLAGIACKQVHISNMVGYALKPNSLIHAGFGHVFVGGPSPVLAYAIGPDETRIMFDVPLQTNGISLAGVPQNLRNAVGHAMQTQAPLRSANYSVVPAAVFKRRLVCAGDAGGCCHPLTATGLSACVRDAVLLRQALRETAGDIPAALRRYAALREGPQRTRLAGADVLYQVFTSQTPDMRLLRAGLFRYWDTSPRGRAATMALLSTHEDRFPAVVREYVQVCRNALPDLVRWRGMRGHAVIGLSRALIKMVGNR